jgi:phage repressor protein C with HTH and peptisase S24 domain
MIKRLLRQSVQRVELASLNRMNPDRALDSGTIDWIARIVWASQ